MSTRETAQPVNEVLASSRILSPRTHVKMSGVPPHAYNLRASEVVVGRPPGLAGQPALSAW